MHRLIERGGLKYLGRAGLETKTGLEFGSGRIYTNNLHTLDEP